jgi:hypothetical protein
VSEERRTLHRDQPIVEFARGVEQVRTETTRSTCELVTASALWVAPVVIGQNTIEARLFQGVR